LTEVIFWSAFSATTEIHLTALNVGRPKGDLNLGEVGRAIIGTANRSIMRL
jgi:hypothetical protein